MKICFSLFLLTLIALSQSACDSCGPFDEGYNWEKKGQITSIPFYPDSLSSDTLTIKVMGWYYIDSVKVTYSSTLDSFRVTADAEGRNFFTPGADTSWKPRAKYVWTKNEMELYMMNMSYQTIQSTLYNSQTAQCVPAAQDEYWVNNISIEVPKQLKFVKLIPQF